MNPALLGTLVVAGVAALDATPVAQTLLSQPLVTSTLLALVWGDWRTALEVGVVLQILAASTLPIGSRTPEDYAIGGVAGSGVALALARHAQFIPMHDACALVGVIVGLLAATIGVSSLKWQRRLNEGLSRWCERELTAGNERALGVAQSAAIALAFAVAVASCALWLWLGLAVGGGIVGRYSLRLARAWEILRPLWMGFGLAQILSALVQRRLSRAGVFAVSLVGAWLFLVVGAE